MTTRDAVGESRALMRPQAGDREYFLHAPPENDSRTSGSAPQTACSYFRAASGMFLALARKATIRIVAFPQTVDA